MYDRHHRLPTSRGGTKKSEGGRDNLITVPRNAHILYHKMFGNMTAPEVAKMLSDTWIDPDYRLVAQVRKGKR
jgi:hypothetical protein